jgi:hypothetical protein
MQNKKFNISTEKQLYDTIISHCMQDKYKQALKLLLNRCKTNPLKLVCRVFMFTTYFKLQGYNPIKLINFITYCLKENAK